MASIFQPILQSQITPERPVELASPIASLANLGEGIVGGLTRAKGEADREARRNAPTYSQIKDERESGALADYTTGLQNLEQLKGQISETAYNERLRKLNTGYLQYITEPSFVAARETITGLPDTLIGRTDTELLLNDLSQTSKGQGEIAFAIQQLKSDGVEPTSEAVASIINQREVNRLAVANIEVGDQLSFQENKKDIFDFINMFTQDTQNSVFALQEAGVPISASMVQDRYVDFLELKTGIEAKINRAPLAQKEDVLKSLQRTEDFFVQLGMTKVDGEIELLNKDELQVTDKVKSFVSILNQSENGADVVLALKLMDQNYKPDPLTYEILKGRMKDLGTKTPVTADWITQADIVVTNDLIGTYENLVAYQKAGGEAQFNKLGDGAISLVNPEEQAKWSGMTNAQGWTATKAFGTASNGFSKQAILSGNLTDGFYNSLAGLALSFESIDILEEPVSFNGLRQEVSSKLPDLIKTAESIDPTKGAAIKALMYRSLVGQSGQYDRRIESDESKLGITFNPKTRTYNLDSNTSDDTRLTLIGITNKHYNGNLVAAIEDGFKRTTLEDLSLLPSTKDAASLSEIGMNNAKQMLSSRSPQVDDVKNLLDLRSSSVYLKNLSLQIEPKASKDAREVAETARESVSAIETTSDIPLESITGFDRIANDTAFLGAVERVSQDLGISNSDLLTAISFETVGTFNPSIKNPGSSATGLIQFIEKTAKGLGTSTAELAKMNNVEQMEYVKRYLEPYKGRMKNLGDVYMAIHWPAGVGKDDSYVMYRDGSKEYTANRNLDVSGDGTVTRGEALQRVRQMTSGGRGAPITMSELPDAPVSGTAEVSPVSVPTVDVAQPDVVAGQAVLPEQDAEAVAEAEAETKAPARTTTPPEIEALIEALGERSLTDEEAQQFREYMSTFKVNTGG